MTGWFNPSDELGYYEHVMPDDDIAVALKYDRNKDSAPRVVAKGMRLRAEKIRELAEYYGVPLMKDVPLAQALFRVDAGQEIPESLYDAVAEVLNFVYALKRAEKAAPEI